MKFCAATSNRVKFPSLILVCALIMVFSTMLLPTPALGAKNFKAIKRTIDFSETGDIQSHNMGEAPLSLTKCPSRGSDQVYYSWGNKWWRNYEGGLDFAKVYISRAEAGIDWALQAGVYWTGGWIGFDPTIQIGQETPVYAFLMDLNEEQSGPPSPSRYEFQIGWRYNLTLNYDNFYLRRETETQYHVVSDHLLMPLTMPGEYNIPVHMADVEWTFEATIILEHQ